MTISLLLLAALPVRAGEDFEAGLEEGRRHGDGNSLPPLKHP